MGMMSRLKEHISVLASLPQRLGRDEDRGFAVMEDMRRDMLALLDDQPGDSPQHIALRIQCAATVQSLWFLRSDLMASLSPIHGERRALELVGQACNPYRKALPPALRARRSSLAAHYDSLP